MGVSRRAITWKSPSTWKRPPKKSSCGPTSSATSRAKSGMERRSLTAGSPCLSGRLSDRHQWFVYTPTEVVLRDGLVTQSQELK